ncbi:isopentenyl phosphate kinase [Methanosphaera cuniculi]|uniref:isopentenyl phosphate kinase n=1 Tax=Methanosphaera cuniculi TaxID=1077256 RepID=UPI0026DB4B34|nr:isopentenyl phosphate kinase [Methanosphaera cuniculi]
MIIIKLGGSALTVKDASTPTLDEENLDRIASEVSYYNDDMIIVHGAGSYGHIYADEYKIGDVITNANEHLRRIEGVCKTQTSVQQLNHDICQKLQQKGIPAVTIKPSSFIVTNQKRIAVCDTTIIKQYLENGFVPVLYGDAVLDMDEDIKFAIISGDQIITYLAYDLKADRVILASDVDGIYTDNPKTNPEAKLIDEVTQDTQLNTTSNENMADVTGGMNGKIQELLKLAENNIQSQIINAQTPGNIQKAVSGQNVKGTIIK